MLDIGGVLEVIDDSVFPGPWPARLGLSDAEFAERLDGLRGDPVVGEVTWPEVLGHWRSRASGSTAGPRHPPSRRTTGAGTSARSTSGSSTGSWGSGRHRLTAILSNSSPGARERERHHGFEAMVDHLVYSHEVGLAKPDPAVYALTARRLGVRPEEVLFLDDDEPRVEAARAAGWQAVLHEETSRSIAEMERIIAEA